MSEVRTEEDYPKPEGLSNVFKKSRSAKLFQSSLIHKTGTSVTVSSPDSLYALFRLIHLFTIP